MNIRIVCRLCEARFRASQAVDGSELSRWTDPNHFADLLDTNDIDASHRIKEFISRHVHINNALDVAIENSNPERLRSIYF